jgi:hypothetical protein
MFLNIVASVQLFQSYSQMILGPAKLLLIGPVIVVIVYVARNVIVQWRKKNRLIDQLQAENSTLQQQIADLQNAMFGGANRHNSVTRHRMLVRSLHEVIPLLRNRNTVVSMMVATDDYLRNIQAAAQGLTLAEFDHLAHGVGADERSGFGYHSTYNNLVSGVMNGWPHGMGETFVLDSPMLKVAPACELSADGWCWTPTEMAEWAEVFVSYAKVLIGEGPVVGFLSTYRYPNPASASGGEYLVASFWNDANRKSNPDDADLSCVELSIQVGGMASNRFHLCEASAPDSAEAIHRIGLVAAALGATMTIGMVRPREERNPVVASGPWFSLPNEPK